MNEAEILDYLTTQGIDYECQHHPAVLTMDEAERLALPHPECEARNLFVRESRTHRYFLLTAHARVDLKAFSRQQGLRPCPLPRRTSCARSCGWRREPSRRWPC